MDNFGRFVRSMDDSIRHLHAVGDANAKRHQDCELSPLKPLEPQTRGTCGCMAAGQSL